MSKSKDSGSSAMWDREATNIFCNLCVREVELGNRPTTFFNKEGWHNITSKFKEITGRDYDRMKLKNKWDQLKKEWKLWKELKRGSTGLGWDPVKRTIDAPEEWWAEKLAVVPVAKKFKFNGIEPALEEKLDGMFTGVVATGTHFSTPNEQGVANLAEDIETEHIGDQGEDPSQTHTDIQSTGGQLLQT
ncbi:L10-interacting MYB domain-containing protein-like [Phalaenopsis equestris]|uniref:L10-interacting MYB domain-containing protein-like n=1 Tax=Phalaenopsis equestris TaxID=78828 RepID=UPI0009E32A30|nr:L10-interacting MYB domain-containing protein-like [Phalaenopsis equestris]